MKCDKCGKALLAEELFCKECGHEQAYHQQRKILHEAEATQKDFIKKKFHSPLFLIITICFTVITLFSLPSIIPAIFMIITTVGLWRCYLAKNDETLVKGIKNMKAYDMFVRVCYYIAMGFFTLGFVISTISIIGSCTAISHTESSDVTLMFLGSWLISLAGFGIEIAIIELFCGIFKRRLDFLDVMKISVLSGTQYALSFSKVGSYFIGLMMLLPAIGGVAISILMTGSMVGAEGILFSLLESIEMDGMSEIIDVLEGLTATLSGLGLLLPVIAVFSGLGNICFGMYYILSAEWMGSARDESRLVVKKTEDAKKKLADIEKETRRQLRLFNQKNNPQTENVSNEKNTPAVAAPQAGSKDEIDENISYSIATNGKASAPVNVKKLREMALSGELLRENLLWKRGMTAWVKAEDIPELADSFPPPIYMPETEFDPSEAPAIPTFDVSEEAAPAEETPVEETPAEETPTEETPVEETPVEETPAEETPTEETPVEETPVEETPVEETPVEETPVEETPVEETPVEETPVEETPVEETPVEEKIEE